MWRKHLVISYLQSLLPKLYFQNIGGNTMQYANVYGAYKEMGIKTASGGKLIVMLYEEALKQLKIALQKFSPEGKIETKDIETFGRCIEKTCDIINELQLSLNMDQGQEIAKNLMALYIYFNKELLDVNINKDKKKLLSIYDMLSQLKDSWQVVSNVEGQTNMKASSSFSVQG